MRGKLSIKAILAAAAALGAVALPGSGFADQFTTTPTLVYQWAKGTPQQAGFATMRISLQGDVVATTPSLTTADIRLVAANLELEFPENSIDLTPTAPNEAFNFMGDCAPLSTCEKRPENSDPLYTLPDGTTRVLSTNWPALGTFNTHPRSYLWTIVSGDENDVVSSSGTSRLPISVINASVGDSDNTAPGTVTPGELVPIIDLTFYVENPVSALGDISVSYGGSSLALQGMKQSDFSLFPIPHDNGLVQFSGPYIWMTVPPTLGINAPAGGSNNGAVVVSNNATSTGVVTISAITELTDPDNKFTVSGFTPGTNVAAGASTPVGNIVFSPAGGDSGSFNATFRVVSSNGTVNETQDIAVTGSVVSGVVDWKRAN